VHKCEARPLGASAWPVGAGAAPLKLASALINAAARPAAVAPEELQREGTASCL
jgi:hypothetical protein